MFEITQQVLYLDKIICCNDTEVDQQLTWPVTCTEKLSKDCMNEHLCVL